MPKTPFLLLKYWLQVIVDMREFMSSLPNVMHQKGMNIIPRMAGDGTAGLTAAVSRLWWSGETEGGNGGTTKIKHKHKLTNQTQKNKNKNPITH